jgi:hypothetical protein
MQNSQCQHQTDLNDLMVLGALAGAEMAMRDVGIDLTLGSCGSAGALPQDHHGKRKRTHRAGTLRTDTSRRCFLSVAYAPFKTGQPHEQQAPHPSVSTTPRMKTAQTSLVFPAQ